MIEINVPLKVQHHHQYNVSYCSNKISVMIVWSFLSLWMFLREYENLLDHPFITLNIKVWVITKRFSPLCNLTDLTGQTDQSKLIWKWSEESRNTRWKCGKDFWFVYLMLQALEELQPSLAQPPTWSWWVSSRGIPFSMDAILHSFFYSSIYSFTRCLYSSWLA